MKRINTRIRSLWIGFSLALLLLVSCNEATPVEEYPDLGQMHNEGLRALHESLATIEAVDGITESQYVSRVKQYALNNITSMSTELSKNEGSEANTIAWDSYLAMNANANYIKSQIPKHWAYSVHRQRLYYYHDELKKIVYNKSYSAKLKGYYAMRLSDKAQSDPWLDDKGKKFVWILATVVKHSALYWYNEAPTWAAAYDKAACCDDDPKDKGPLRRLTDGDCAIDWQKVLWYDAGGAAMGTFLGGIYYWSHQMTRATGLWQWTAAISFTGSGYAGMDSFWDNCVEPWREDQSGSGGDSGGDGDTGSEPEPYPR